MPTSPVLSAYSLALALAVALLTLGCGHGTSERRPEPAPPHLRGGAALDEHAAGRAAAAPTSNVSLVDPNSTKEVTLGAMLAFADAHSPVLAVARSTRSRAEAARVAASPWLPANPELTLGLGPRSTSVGNGLDFQAALSQRIEIAGERGLRMEAAERLGDLTEAEIEELRWSVHADVHATFHRAIVERERAKLAERVLTFQEELLRIVERQVSAGETAPLTHRLAQAEVAQARQSVVATRQAHYATCLRLAQLSGWPVDRPPLPAGALDAPRDPPPLAELIAVGRSRLPLLRTRLAMVREARARAGAADRDSWLEPAIGVQYSREDNPGPEGPSSVLLGTLSIPIPSFQRNQGERAHARADLLVARAELDAAHALLDGTIAEARSAVVAAAERVRSYGDEVLPRIEENLGLLRRSFELGEIDLLELSIGRERFLRIQNDALGAHLDYLVALADLERAIGADVARDEHHEESAK